MIIDDIKNKLFEKSDDPEMLKFNRTFDIKAYLNSFNNIGNVLTFIGKEGINKHLYILSLSKNDKTISLFDGELITIKIDSSEIFLKKCPLNHANSEIIQKHFDFTRPVTIGLTNSFGFGDRLGLANAGHIRSLRGYKFKPIFAQQSIRELTRTNRTAENVIDAAVWAVLQEGYKDGYGADADHLKTKADVDMMVKTGYRTFTIDPSDHIVNGVENITPVKLSKDVANLPWDTYGFHSSKLILAYENKEFKINKNITIAPSLIEILSATLKYLKAIVHIKNLCDYIKTEYKEYECEIEVSIDETETITTPFEHFFLVNELKNLNVEFVSLALRFIGDFEKGIDYKGDIEIFKNDYIVHQAIAKHFGNYKLSFHSGSDKFTAYKAVAEVNDWYIHIKTAGTSYLEALKVAALKAPDLFRDILDYSRSIYNTEKATYHVSANIEKIKKGKDYTDDELLPLMSIEDHRQVLHVAYGRVLTEKDASGNYTFREKLYKCLDENENLYYDFLIKHFHRHMDPFNKQL